MSKLLIKIFVALAALLNLVSCNNYDKEGEYTFRYVLEYRMQTKEDVEPLTQYFKNKLDFETPITMKGKQSEVIQLAAEQFFKLCQEKFTKEEVESYLPNEYDAVALNLVMVVGSGFSYISQIYWVNDPDAEESLSTALAVSE